jgi:hypothetical protein
MIKIISYPNLSNVEDTFSNWISKNNVNIISIDFFTASHENELWYSILIHYNEVNRRL